MPRDDFQLTVLGARGSIPVGGPEYSEFGGNTSCYLVRAGEETVFLDAGSGLLSAPSDASGASTILLSHLHLDHVIGLGMSPLLSRKDQTVKIYVPFCADEASARAVLDRLYSPPFWPVQLDQLGARLQLQSLPDCFHLGALRIEAIAGNHPGGCVIYKLSRAGKTLVYASDYEHSEEGDARLAAFARGADLLLYDAQFSPAGYERKKGFGHSTAERGLALMERAQVRRLLLIHHNPSSTDRVLQDREMLLGADRASYAREGQTVFL